MSPRSVSEEADAMIGYRHLIAVGLLALCACAASPALAQAGAEREGTQLYATEEEARQREAAADLRDRVSQVEGRLEGIEEATIRAAAAGEHAAKASAEAARASQEVITTIGQCTKFITGLIAFIGVVLGALGYRELKGLEVIRDRADTAVKEAEEERKKAEAARQEAEASLAMVEHEVRSLRERAGALVGETEESAQRAQDLLGRINELHTRAAQLDPTKERTADEKDVLDDASRASELLEDLGQELTPDAYIARGNRYYYREEYERALEEYDRAVDLKPEYAQAHFRRGITLTILERYDEAVRAYDEAIRWDGRNAQAHYNRAVVCALLDKPEEALRNLRRAIAIDWRLRGLAQKDGDSYFASLRDDPEFRKLVGLEEEGEKE
jgi:tetratricopeptide (TPR) repeat protein